MIIYLIVGIGHLSLIGFSRTVTEVASGIGGPNVKLANDLIGCLGKPCTIDTVPRCTILVHPIIPHGDRQKRTAGLIPIEKLYFADHAAP